MDSELLESERRRSGEPLVAARRLCLGYAGPVVVDVDLEVREAERWFWIGPNGAGKTTLLRGVLGLLAPRAGSLTLRADLRDRSRVGFVPQRCEWTPTLPTTLREFVELGLVGTRIPRAEAPQRVDWALGRVSLGERASVQYSELSGGQRQRALLARALVRRPALLLLDEPTEELDVGAEAALLETLEDLQRDLRTALVVVTHELELAARYATHVAVFEHGRVTAGPRDAVLRGEAVQRAFGPAAAGILG